jgi:hypothetical protein
MSITILSESNRNHFIITLAEAVCECHQRKQYSNTHSKT